jgi:type VI secretion system secreted protein VgrG
MANYSQANRPLKVDTALGEDVLLLEGVSGSEGISTPYYYTLDLISENAAVAAADVLRTPVTVTIKATGGDRFIHGIVRSFTQLGRSDELTSYRAEVVPWFWFLSLSNDCKIFQNLSVPDIVEQVFQGLGYKDFQNKLVKSYPKRLFCVQYRETHLNFVQRLLEEEGIFYFFEHASGKHTLTLADDNSAVKPCPVQAVVRMATTAGPWQGEDVVTACECEVAVHTGKVTLRDYDPQQPTLQLESSVAGEHPEEAYHYPGKYTALDEGERYARLQLEAEEAQQRVVRGAGSCRTLQSGYRFDLKEHYRKDANQAYMLLELRHSARAGDYRSWDSAPFDYRNDFLAIPHSVPFRPLNTTPKPRIWGSQTALVVGKAGEEIWTDKHGRIKVQFYWDRLGKKDENSSCWIRVAQPWAGKGWGSLAIPRIGQEVVVEFLEGDPDLPLVTGSVYNADQSPPYDPGKGGVVSGLRSNTHKGKGYNEMSMNDTAGKEMVTVHGQYDMSTTVGHDQSNTVGNNRTTSIAVDDSEKVGSNQKIDVGSNQNTTVGANQTLKVGADQTNTIGANQKSGIGSNQELTVGADQKISVGGTQTTAIGANQNTNVSASRTTDVAAADKLTVGGTETISAKGPIEVSSDAKITLSAGGSKIEIGPAGITIQTGAKVTVQGAVINLN